MPRNKKALYSLARPKLRSSWHKINLYHLDKVKNPIRPNMTYFQQKWTAKKMTRAYHGNTVKEMQWRRMFRPDMRSVISLDAESLGKYDGSYFSAGRGSGRLGGSLDKMLERVPRPVPYSNMVYHQIERRLDVAIWRALFASSTKQARQFVVHGGVTVNGRKMIYPGYQLNPGDMFQVEVERVMFATGARKNYWERRFGRQDRRRGYGIVRGAKRVRKDADNEIEADVEAEPEPTETDSNTMGSDSTSTSHQSKNKLNEWLEAAKLSLSDSHSKAGNAARKRALRDFTRTVRKELGSKASWDTPINEQITLMAEKLSLDDGQSKDESKLATDQSIVPLTQTLKADQERILQQALTRMKENPLDFTKGYKTPWEPRPYMSAFAYIPRYLEVHAPICAAVYLRHPVARSGLGEVPTPFPEAVNSLAFNWYLRRR